MAARKIAGKFCERKLTPSSRVAKASFRWKQSGKAWVLVGCPKNKWQPRKQRCRIGMKAVVVLAPKGSKPRCPKGQRAIKKGSK